MLRRLFLIFAFATLPMFSAHAADNEVETLADLQKMTDNLFWGWGWQYCGTESEKLCKVAKEFFNGHDLEQTWKKMDCSPCAKSNAFCGSKDCKTWRTTISPRVACAYFGLCGSHQKYDPDERARMEREALVVGVILVGIITTGMAAVTVKMARDIYRLHYPAKETKPVKQA